MKKLLKIILVFILVAIVAVVVVLTTQLDKIVTTAVNDMGPKFTQTEVNLEKFKLRLLQGQATLEGFTVGNPEGYKTPAAMELGKLHVELEPKSLMSDTIHIKEILIDGPQITMEMGLRKSNIGKIQENIESYGGAKDETAKESEEESTGAAEKPGKKVLIDHVYVKNGKIKLSTKMLQGKSLNVPLPEIHLKDIGKEKEAGLVDVVKEVTGAITKAIVGAATGALKGAAQLGGEAVGAVGNAAGEGAKAVGGAAKEAGSAAAEAAGEGAKAVGGAAKEVGSAAAGAAGEGAKAVGGAAKEVGSAAAGAAGEGAKAVGGAAKEVGGAAADGVKSVVGGIKNLVPGKKD